MENAESQPSFTLCGFGMQLVFEPFFLFSWCVLKKYLLIFIISFTDTHTLESHMWEGKPTALLLHVPILPRVSQSLIFLYSPLYSPWVLIFLLLSTFIVVVD